MPIGPVQQLRSSTAAPSPNVAKTPLAKRFQQPNNLGDVPSTVRRRGLTDITNKTPAPLKQHPGKSGVKATPYDGSMTKKPNITTTTLKPQSKLQFQLKAADISDERAIIKKDAKLRKSTIVEGDEWEVEYMPEPEPELPLDWDIEDKYKLKNIDKMTYLPIFTKPAHPELPHPDFDLVPIETDFVGSTTSESGDEDDLFDGEPLSLNSLDIPDIDFISC